MIGKTFSLCWLSSSRSKCCQIMLFSVNILSKMQTDAMADAYFLTQSCLIFRKRSIMPMRDPSPKGHDPPRPPFPSLETEDF